MKILNIVIVLGLAIASVSCRSMPKQDLEYFQDIRNSTEGVLPTVAHTNTIDKESELVITVKSDVPEATQQFNMPYVNPTVPGTVQANAQSQLQTYKVDKDGNIDFPVLGELHVSGMTTYELKDMLAKRISQYVKNPIVNVTLRNYRIVVMGEVKAPQTIYTSADRFSVLDALAEAGDLTDYGLRDNILVLRRGEGDNIEYFRINLQDSRLTTSPAFWLRNNDVVLVSPNRIKEDNSKYNQNNAYKLSVISTIVGMSTAVISLIIALAIK